MKNIGEIKNLLQNKKAVKTGVLSLLTCLVILGVVNMLILPASTMEKQKRILDCPLKIHQHTDECYQNASPEGNGSEKVLSCGFADYVIHQHTDACKDENGNLVCTIEESNNQNQHEIHTHSDECYNENGDLTCELLQLEEHIHSDACFRTETESNAKSDPIENRANNIEPTAGAAKSLSAIPEDILNEIANKWNIYPYEKQNDQWIAMDGANEENSKVKATVKFPEGTNIPENYYLFIRKVNEGEGHYPTADAIKEAVGEYNDFQCYAIHWIQIWEEDGAWKYDYNTDSVLKASESATIKIEYLNDESLEGHKAERKLMVFNSQIKDGQPGGILGDISATIETPTANDNAYTGFTFTTSKAGPYVFVSKKLAPGYIKELRVNKIVDGTAPFDKTDGNGNDSNDHNNVVRSFDTIQYDLSATVAPREATVTAKSIDMHFELILKKSITDASFNTSKMLWLKDNYKIEFLDENDKLLMTMDHEGNYRDTNNNIVSLNKILESSNHGKDSYTIDSNLAQRTAKQKLTGWIELKGDDKNPNVLILNKTFSAAINVMNADNEDEFTPEFRMWLDGNEDNYGSESVESGSGSQIAEKVTDNKVIATPVKVSAGAFFNMQLLKNTDFTYKNWFDFKTGMLVDADDRTKLEELAALPHNKGVADPSKFKDKNENNLTDDLKERYSNYRYGRLTGYGITLQLYNSSDAGNQVRASKKFKGVSLPAGNITFELNMKNTVKKGNNDLSEAGNYTPILWDYNENIDASSKYDNNTYGFIYEDRTLEPITASKKGHWQRNIYWNNETRSPYAKGAAPSNYKFFSDGCYYGGGWNITNFNAPATPADVANSGANITYEFEVKDYDFDFNTRKFPTRLSGNSGDITGYNNYIGCFSAGYIQVMNIMPRYHEGTIDLENTITVNKLSVTTRKGDKCEAGSDDSTGYAHEVIPNDNVRKDKVDLYATGGATKGNSFNKEKNGKKPNTVGNGYLGTDYWTTSYDCNAYAGDNIYILGYGMLQAYTDYRIKSMNLLQLFDSKALSINETADDKIGFYQDVPTDLSRGTSTVLYAADPDYKEGYDTNQKGVQEYISTVREEDLIYFDSLEKLEAQGYKCIGVLWEIRGCDIMGGRYQYIRIPVKVNGDDPELVGKTVSTVNTLRIWSDDLGNLSWKNGKWDETKGKNVLEGFKKPTGTVDPDTESYSVSVENGSAEDGKAYIKTEYEDGKLVKDTHKNGVHYGNSLLILSYEAKVGIGIEGNPSTSGNPSYNIDSGENVVTYKIHGIETKTKENQPGSSDKKTDLTILVKADIERNNTEKCRMSITGQSFTMMGYKVDNDNKPDGNEQKINISIDPDKPSTIGYYIGDKFYTIKIYAARSADGSSVTFHIKEASVGKSLPDITFQADINPSLVKNNDTITTEAYISGTGDCRAYEITKGNMGTQTIGIIQGTTIRLVKSVDTRLTELDGKFTYTVTYTNNSTEDIPIMYFTDVKPNLNDERGSKFEGDLDIIGIDSEHIAKPFDTATIYYSDTADSALQKQIEGFRNIKGLLTDSTFKKLGTMNDNGELTFAPNIDKDKLKDLNITALCAEVHGFKANSTLALTMTVKSHNNNVSNLYRNIAHTAKGSDSSSDGNSILTSNRVDTTVIDRAISGVVWYDTNMDGIRDEDNEDEQLLSNITATLFKKNANGKYEKCTTGVNGRNIRTGTNSDGSPQYTSNGTCTTDSDGAYSFNYLASGDYVVAFSSNDEDLKYTKATTYQVSGKNDAYGNDGVAMTSLDNIEFENGINKNDYLYAIKYSPSSANMTMHTINELNNGKGTLTNYTEAYRNQDLGLVISDEYQLPDTGGTGVALLYICGGMLMMGAAVVYVYRRKKAKL